MTHAWIDATAGVAGDMLLGAALDAGAPLDLVQRAVDAVAADSVRLRVDPVVRGGQRGSKLTVEVLVDDPPHRTWASIRTMLADAPLDGRVRAWAHAAFERLAVAEATVHGTSVDDVHFHEVGALDSIADVVGFCAALDALGVTEVSASPIAPGAGRVRAAHGDIPVPVPAVAELLLGWRTSVSPGSVGQHHHHDSQHDHGDSHDHGHPHSHDHGHSHDHPAAVTTPGEVGELATPTGVALVRSLAQTCEPFPAMTVTAIGIGAGGKDFSSHPNVVRLLIGEPSSSQHSGSQQQSSDHPGSPDFDHDHVTEVQANVDDLDPRLWPGIIDGLLASGARDAWTTPILMKKGRPGFTLHALVDDEHRGSVIETILTTTPTLGVREHALVRTMLRREWREVVVLGHRCRVKVGLRADQIVHATPEFSDLAAIATATGRSEYEVSTLATAAMVNDGLTAILERPPTPQEHA